MSQSINDEGLLVTQDINLGVEGIRKVRDELNDFLEMTAPKLNHQEGKARLQGKLAVHRLIAANEALCEAIALISGDPKTIPEGSGVYYALTEQFALKKNQNANATRPLHRAQKILRAGGKEYYAEIVSMTEEEFLAMEGAGSLTLRVLRRHLAEKGLQFGMRLPDSIFSAIESAKRKMGSPENATVQENQ